MKKAESVVQSMLMPLVLGIVVLHLIYQTFN